MSGFNCNKTARKINNEIYIFIQVAKILEWTISICTNSCPCVNTKLNEYQKHSINKAVRKVINTMFNVIIWGNYSSSKTDESTNSNTTALYFRTYAG